MKGDGVGASEHPYGSVISPYTTHSEGRYLNHMFHIHYTQPGTLSQSHVPYTLHTVRTVHYFRSTFCVDVYQVIDFKTIPYIYMFILHGNRDI